MGQPRWGLVPEGVPARPGTPSPQRIGKRRTDCCLLCSALVERLWVRVSSGHDPGSGAAVGSSVFSTLRSQSTSASPLGTPWAVPVLSGEGSAGPTGGIPAVIGCTRPTLWGGFLCGRLRRGPRQRDCWRGAILGATAGAVSGSGAMASGVSLTLSAPTWPEASSA